MSVKLPSPQLTVKDWLDDAVRQLVFSDVPSARLDSELILAHTLRKNRSYLHAHPEAPLSVRDQQIATARLELRLDRVPVAYIIGHKEFYGRRFRVTTATLIPRPETEILIDLLTEAMAGVVIKPGQEIQIVDVGTGSGVIGITAKLLFPHASVTLVDSSIHALKVAEKNAKDHTVAVTTITSDLLDSYPLVADIIIANLPYVDPSWKRSPETNHEPKEALFADDNGLHLIKKLLEQTASKLRTSGYVILEADPEQHDAIIKTAQTHGLLLLTKQDYGLLLQKIK